MASGQRPAAKSLLSAGRKCSDKHWQNHICLTSKTFFIMAKGNMFQGMARGKVGDVVFSRTDGEQISRVRNRHPKNPRTNKQLYQRAIMATVMQAYKAGQEIFNHSFEGKAQGAECQRQFLSKNAKLLRSLIAAEIEAGTTALNCRACVVAPGSINPVPNAYMVSEGTYDQNFFSWNDTSKDFSMPAPTSGETVAAYAERIGLVSGDIYTFAFFGIVDSNALFVTDAATVEGSLEYQPGNQYAARFGFVRLQVKSDLTSTDALNNLGQLFEVTAISSNAKSNFDLVSTLITDEMGLSSFVSSLLSALDNNLGSICCIRSREDEDLRSTSYMYPAMKVVDVTANGMYGIVSPYALPAWKQGTENLGDSDLILEGGDE